MDIQSVAYGLRIECSFDLPGMAAIRSRSQTRLPALSLDLLDPPELERAWSGAVGPPAWRGRLGDGLDMVIDLGVMGDVLFTYGDHARFLLDRAMLNLGCAPEVRGLDWQRALLSKVLPHISVMRGYEALHASVVDSSGAAVAIMGPSGAGKSTLATGLLRRGWSLVADDLLVLERVGGRAVGHPGTSHMNLPERLPDAESDSLGETIGVLAGERWVSARTLTAEPVEVGMLCLLARGSSLSLEARALPPNPLHLAPYVVGLPADPERQRRRFALYADLIESATLVQLTASHEHTPEQIADLVEQTLADSPQMVGGGVDQ
jgi:hypothetical protein